MNIMKTDMFVIAQSGITNSIQTLSFTVYFLSRLLLLEYEWNSLGYI